MAEYIVKVGEEGFTKPTVIGELVRCEDCIHWGKFPALIDFPQYHKCGMSTYKATKADDYCSDGKTEGWRPEWLNIIT